MRCPVRVFALAFLVANVAAAQAPSVAVATRVRITAPKAGMDRNVGTVIRMWSDSISVSGKNGVYNVALRDVTTLEVSAGTRNRAVRGGLIGFGTGALVGAGIGTAGYEECEIENSCLIPMGRAAAVGTGAAAGGVLGLLGGAMIGAFMRVDRWEARSVPMKAALRPSSSAPVTLVVSTAF